MRITMGMAPLAIVAVTFASCGVASERTYEGRELPAPAGTVEVAPEIVDTLPPIRPVGAIERADVLIPGFVTIAGWVDDGTAGNPVELTAWLDLQVIGTVPADGTWSATAGSTGTGFAFDVPLSPGNHVVCVSTSATDTTPIDCVELVGEPVAAGTGAGTDAVFLTAVRSDPRGAATVRGVTTRSDDGRPSTLDVSSTVGVLSPVGSDEPITTVDVVNQAFRFQVTGLTAGSYAVCPDPSGVSVQPRSPTPAAADGCGTIVIGEMGVGTTGLATGIEAVAPSPDHPLYLMERDGGVSVELSDGSTIWFFGDTMRRRPDGSLSYFVHNTAAWSSSDAPTVTRDAVSGDGEPFLFAEAPAGTCNDSPYSDAGLWPESAVAIPRADGTDRVVVVMSKVCLGATWLEIDTIGFAVAEFSYDPDDPPADRSIRGEITQPDLAAAEAGYGRALLLEPDGHLYGYQCGEFPDSWGPCRAARVPHDDVTDVTAWRYWNGDDWTDPASWVVERSAAVEMNLPGAEEHTLPVAAFGVVHNPSLDAHLMVYSPWPGFCSELAIRVSDTPVGPWTEPVPITLPDCSDETAGLTQTCYAATPQMHLCAGDEFAGGYFDMMTDLGVGRYLTFVTPFVVTRAEG